MFIILPNTQLNLQKYPKTFEIMPKWRNFAQSGHTGHDAAWCVGHWVSWSDDDDLMIQSFLGVAGKQVSVWPTKNRQMSMKVAQKRFSLGKMKDFNTFTKIA